MKLDQIWKRHVNYINIPKKHRYDESEVPYSHIDIVCYSPPFRCRLLYRICPLSAAVVVLLLRLVLLLVLRAVLNRDPWLVMFPAGPQPAREFRLAVFPAGPQPRASAGSVPCRTSTARVVRQCSPQELNCELRLAVFPAGPQPRVRRYAR